MDPHPIQILSTGDELPLAREPTERGSFYLQFDSPSRNSCDCTLIEYRIHIISTARGWYFAKRDLSEFHPSAARSKAGDHPGPTHLQCGDAVG